MFSHVVGFCNRTSGGSTEWLEHRVGNRSADIIAIKGPPPPFRRMADSPEQRHSPDNRLGVICLHRRPRVLLSLAWVQSQCKCHRQSVISLLQIMRVLSFLLLPEIVEPT